MLTLIRCPFHPRVTAVACKRSRSFCQKCRWRVTPNTHTPLTQRSRSGLTMPLSRHSAGTYPENELTRNLSGNIRPQSSQLAEPLWTDPGIKSAGGDRMVEHSPKILAREERATANSYFCCFSWGQSDCKFKSVVLLNAEDETKKQNFKWW